MTDATGQQQTDQRTFVWTAETEQLLNDWRNRAYAAQTGYYIETERLRRLHYMLGIPAVVASSVVGTTIFANLEKARVATWLRVMLATVSILAAVLMGLQTFLRLAEQASLHSAAAAWYSAIRRDIDATLGLPAQLRGDPREFVSGVRKEMNKAGQNAPELSERLWTRLAQRFGVKEPPWKPLA